MTYIEAKTRQKIAYLERLLKLRLNFMRYATDVSVHEDDGIVWVVWKTEISRELTPQQQEEAKYNLRDKNTQIIEFPVAHLGRRIEHYKRKFRAEFKNRNVKNNV